MTIQENYSIKNINTFSIDAKTKYYSSPSTKDELTQLLTNQKFDYNKLLIIGGGSNLLFVRDFDGLIIHPNIKGKEIFSENSDEVILRANANEDWDEFVEWTVEKGFSGIENLSKIPGVVGACPVQNIGAYGVEVGDLIYKVEAIEIATGMCKQFSKNDCQFGYRNSIFKQSAKGKYIITSVDFKLSKKHEFKTHYGAVEKELDKLGEINLKNIRKAIINIRDSKLPDPEELPNAGSFFKNPMVSKQKKEELEKQYPEIASYKVSEQEFKIAAGWMIDYLGWKGKSYGGAAVHENQALVLVNKDNATGKDIVTLAAQIQDSVKENFGVELEFEVNIID